MLSQNTMIYRLTLYVVLYHHNIQSVIHAEQTVAFNIHVLYQMLLYFTLHYIISHMLSQNTMVYCMALYVVLYHHSVQSVIRAEQTVIIQRWED